MKIKKEGCCGSPFCKEDEKMKPVGIYIHVPFCASKCPYCDFYSFCGSENEKNAYTDALVREITKYKGRNIEADTVYFGGGTPSLLGKENLCRVLDAVKDSFCVPDSAEITLEANPGDELYGLFCAVREKGVNRLSMGAQSGVDSELKALGRRHTRAQTAAAVNEARRAGIDNISLDLMLAIPDQTAATLRESIDFITSLSPNHVSAYLLKIEENTPFGKNPPVVPDDDAAADLYELAVERLDAAGYEQYEISNFAKKGFESRHNTKYWHDEEYIGFGAGAHSFFEGKRFYYPRSASDYIKGIEPVPDGTGGSEEEYVMLRLRLSEGITESAWMERFGTKIPEKYRKNAESLIKAGLAECDENGIRLTKRGFLLSNPAILTIIGE